MRSPTIPLATLALALLPPFTTTESKYSDFFTFTSHLESNPDESLLHPNNTPSLNSQTKFVESYACTVSTKNTRPVILELRSAVEHFNELKCKYPKPTKKSLANSHKIIDFCEALGIAPTQIAPSVEGGVTLSFQSSARFAAIECDNDGEILAALPGNKNEVSVWEITEQSLVSSLEKIHAYITNVASHSDVVVFTGASTYGFS